MQPSPYGDQYFWVLNFFWVKSGMKAHAYNLALRRLRQVCPNKHTHTYLPNITTIKNLFQMKQAQTRPRLSPTDSSLSGLEYTFI